MLDILIDIFFPRNSKLQGISGEYKVKKIIKKTNTEKDYYVINDLRFYDGDKSVQIDHIVISKNYFLCIETKHFSGMIFGKEEQYEWTQTLNYGKVKNKFYNPIKQNQNHIKSLKNILSNNEIDIENVVVFTNKSKIDKIKDIKQIFNFKKLKKKLKYINKESINAKEIYDILNKIKLNQNISNKEHIKNIKSRNKNIK